MEDQIPEGRRNQDLASLAGTMRRRGMSEDEIAAAILVANKQRCDPPLPDEEVQRIAASVGRYAPESTLLPVTLTLTKPPSNSIENTPVAGLPTDHVDVVAPIGGQQQQQGRFCRQTLGDLRANYKPTRWLIEHLLPIIGILLMAGIPGIGKTWLVLLFALVVATGRSLLGRFQTRQGAVLLVLEEEDSSAVLERLDALYAGLELSQEEGDALPIHVLIQQGVSLVTVEGTLEPELLRHIEEVKPVLVVLDPFRRVHGLDENDSGQMSALFNLLRQLQVDMNCSLLLIHHLRKRSEHTEDALDRLRGSSDIAASVDSVLEIGGQFGSLVVKHSKSKRGRALGSFLIKSEMMSGAIRFSYQDSDIAAEIDREEIRKFILQILSEGPLNQSKLWEAGKERGFGRDRIKKACVELEKERLVEQQVGPRNSKLFILTDLVVDAPAPPSTTRSQEEETVEREEWVL